jgi:hypothetical protein
VIAASAVRLIGCAGSGAPFSLLAGVAAVAALLSFESAAAAASVGELSSSGAAKMVAVSSRGGSTAYPTAAVVARMARQAAIALVVTMRFDFVLSR